MLSCGRQSPQRGISTHCLCQLHSAALASIVCVHNQGPAQERQQASVAGLWQTQAGRSSLQSGCLLHILQQATLYTISPTLSKPSVSRAISANPVCMHPLLQDNSPHTNVLQTHLIPNQ